MAFDRRLKELVLVFELENTQDSYARCLRTIDHFEKKILNANGNAGEFYSNTKKIPENQYIMSVNQRRNGPNDKMENSINPNVYARNPVPPDEEEALLTYAVDSWRKKEKRLEPPLYHIRVKCVRDSKSKSYPNIDNLQFLAMFMQQVYITCFPNVDNVTHDELQKRLSVFLIPYNGISYKFADEDPTPDLDLYTVASQYLRLITKVHNGVIYGCSKFGKVEALKFNNRKKNAMWFPLLYLGNTELNDNYIEIFETSGMRDASEIKSGFTCQINDVESWPFEKADEKNPHDAIGDIILDETRARLLTSFASLSESKLDDKMVFPLGREKILEFADEIAGYAKKCGPFTFALFGYLLFFNNKDKTIIKKTIEETMKLARELGDGVRQIVQNAIQHSDRHMCYISFFVKDVNKSGKIENRLCIRVTDFNEEKTIVETFMKILKTEEKDGFFNGKGEDKAVNISIEQLMGEFGSKSPDNPESQAVLNAWYDFRKKDSSAHIGLTLFHNILKRCQYQELQIINSKKSKLYPASVFAGSGSNADVPPQPEYIIPGTQVYFSIPITTIKNSSPVNLVQLANNGMFSENHEAFAHYLGYTVTVDLWKKHMSRPEYATRELYSPKITDAESKAKAQNEWKKFWDALLESSSEVQNQIHYYNLDDGSPLTEFLGNRDNCEIFIKGFLAAASLYRQEVPKKKDEYCPSCFYLRNLPVHFIDILQEVIVSLSLMDYSPNLQVFFSCAELEDDKKEKDVKKRKQQPKQLVILGDKVAHAIQNAYIMSLEHGEQGIDASYYRRVSEILLPYSEIIEKEKEEEKEKRKEKGDEDEQPIAQKVCPFTVFCLPYSREIPQYFKQIKEIAGRPLTTEDESNRGYQFTDIHMRLGNKVHATSFYEMSFLFYRTSVANRVAFYILQKIKDDLCKVKGEIVFFGYASYSQAIIFSMQKMLEEYFKKTCIKKNVYYAIYQFNLQAESDYSDIVDKPGDKMRIYSTLKKIENVIISTSVVQIVPIGSTLTTFDKMRAKYCKDRDDKKIEKSKIISNYNVFLVHEKKEKDKKSSRSKIEVDFWGFINPRRRRVSVNTKKMSYLRPNPKISYIIDANSQWSRPTECEQCFPDDVLEEDRLIETDPTSTVPTLQIYQKESAGPNKTIAEDLTTNNVLRLIGLRKCVYYGHFVRGRNHYQYYIDTLEYISKQEIKDQLKNWLEKERKNEYDRLLRLLKEKGKKEVKTTPVLNIIFAPEHNTSVDFSQFVNAYYFNGTAEIVSINVDKQFRSNFICEHDALRQTIKRLFDENQDAEDTEYPNDESPIHFFFVDDSIISGTSYYRANDLLKSLIPEDKRVKYRGPVFSKCFVLINRLSRDTQESYISKPWDNFLSFCNVNISNTRKQGDSCVGCKLEREAKQLFKRSSTRSFTNYWIKKAGSHQHVMFDDTEKINEQSKEKAFVRMLLTHVIENFIKKYGASREMLDRLFNLILDESMKELRCDTDENKKITIIHDNEETALVKVAFKALSSDKKRKKEEKIVDLLEHLIKLLSRPFLSYNFDLKKHVLSFIINICESVLKEGTHGGIAGKVKDVLVKADPERVKLLDFIKNCLFESLADMKSTYLLRKKTIGKAYRFTLEYANLLSEGGICPDYGKDSCRCIALIKPSDMNDEEVENEYKKNSPCSNSQVRCFWKRYAFHIQYIIDGGGDETRSLWMEHLFVHGDEHSKDSGNKKEVKKGILLPLYEAIVPDGASDNKAKQLFEEFCMEIFFQNCRLLYDGIEKQCEKSDDTKANDTVDTVYFLQNFYKMREWDLEWASVDAKSKKVTNIEKIMFNFLSSDEQSLDDTYEKYKISCRVISHLINDKYDIPLINLNIAMLTQKDNSKLENMDDYNFIADNIPEENTKRTAKARYFIKQRIIWALSGKYVNTRLIEDGYCLIRPTDDEKYDDDDDFDLENDNNSSRKPFFILRFDNIQVKRGLKLDRGAQPIEKVFLYVSFGYKSTEPDKEKLREKLKVAPILIMRDILSYRDRIMRVLEKDFSSHLMQIHARKTGENAILKHEKTVSHLSTFDDRYLITLWSNKPIKDYEYEWLLFRSNINSQIAKLFKRTLLLVDEESINQPPKLYLQDKIQNEGEDWESTDALPAEIFEDLWSNADRRLELCMQIIDFDVDEKLYTGQLVNPTHNHVRGYFNLEYLKCILFDIFFTCAKYWNEDANFLSRIKTLKKYKKRYKDKLNEGTGSDIGVKSLNAYDRQRSKIWLMRSGNDLVIINPIKTIDNNILNGWKELSKQIMIQLRNQYDSFDGHMSLFTISNYIKNNNINYDENDQMFDYKLFEDLEPNWKNRIKAKCRIKPNDKSLWFVSKLPIFDEEV
jgi:hypothetical protein